MRKKILKGLTILAIVIMVFYVVGLCLVNSCSIVQPRYAGIKITLGSIEPKSYSNGIVWHYPFISTVDTLKVSQLVHKYELNVKDVDGQRVIINGAVNYSANKDSAHVLYVNIGKDYLPVVLQPLLESTVNQVLGSKKALFIMQEQAMIQEAIFYIMNDQLEATNLVKVVDLRLFAPTFEESFQKALDEKFTAQQLALKAAEETKRVREEAEQMYLKLKAEARGMEDRSNALKNPLIIEYEYAKAFNKWDGGVPGNLVLGGDAHAFAFMK